MDPLRILIIGAGAIGCFVGGKLAAAGHSVTLVGRPRTTAAIRARGLALRATGGATQTIPSISAVSSVRDALPSPFHLVILAVKSYDTAAALDELASAGAAPPPAILSLQNGVGNEEAIADRFGAQRALAGTITAPVEAPEPGLVHVTKPGFSIGLADFGGGSGAARHSDQSSFLAALASRFSAAGLPAQVHQNARDMKWTKLLMNMIGNASSAILAQPPGVTFADPRISNLEIDALREALRVMKASDIRPLNLEKYPLGTLAPLLRFGPRALLRPALHKVVGGARGGKMPSLFLDLDAGKRASEVGWYNGAIVRRGGEIGLDAPVNRLLTVTVQQLAADHGSRAGWRGNYARLAATASELSGS